MPILMLVPVWFILALVIPTLWTVARHYRKLSGHRPVICPQTGLVTTIELNAGHAVAMGILGNPVQKVQSCLRWPAHQNCARQCVAQFEPVA
jgi:hypothetical protein